MTCKFTRMGKNLRKETALSTLGTSQKGKTFGVWLGRWRECSVKRGKGKFLYSLRIAQSALHFSSLAVLFSQTPSLGSMQPYAAINARSYSHTYQSLVYCQVFIYAAE